MLKRAILALALGVSIANAQTPDTATSPLGYSRSAYWRRLGAGVMTSILLHEAGHFAASFASGAHPSVGFDKGRPTVYSGIDLQKYPRRQFWFSSMGLDVQSVLDEALLDIPHHRGSAFERGLLGGGIGTTVFYLTIGRVGSVSDIEVISRTRVMTKTQATFLYGTIALMHTWRVSRNPAYDHFFVGPASDGFVAGYRKAL